jgi:serine/threonine protein kinase
MITGDVPFNAANPLGLLMKHITEPPVQPSQVNPEIKKNPDFEMIIMKCLEKEPDKRFQTMDELYANFIRVHQQLSNQGTERLKALPYAPSLTRYHRTIIRKKYFAVSMWSIAAILLISLIAVIIMKIIHNEPSENVVQQLQTVLTDAIIDSHEVFQAKTSMISPLSQEMIKEAVLLVNSTPDDADVYFPEEKVSRGKTPVSLKIRSNEIPQFLIITKKGYQKKVFATEKIKNSLAAGENVELKINLEKTTSQKKKVNSLEGWKP